MYITTSSSTRNSRTVRLWVSNYQFAWCIFNRIWMCYYFSSKHTI